MHIDFPFILIFLVLISGLIAAIDKFLIKSDRSCALASNARSLFWVFVVIFIFRIFIAKPFIVPSQSLEPTVLPGDFLLVNQFTYGLRFPVWHKKLLKIGQPKRGDIAVFRWPVNPEVNFVKRVVAVPGDKISYVNKVLYINGKIAKQKFINYAMDTNDGKHYWRVRVMQENLAGIKHKIYLCAKDAKSCPGNREKEPNFHNVVVPQGQYFMMGDNRDDSEDSRVWGLVPDGNLIGKALMIWMSWGGWHHPIRFSRIGFFEK